MRRSRCYWQPQCAPNPFMLLFTRNRSKHLSKFIFVTTILNCRREYPRKIEPTTANEMNKDRMNKLSVFPKIHHEFLFRDDSTGIHNSRLAFIGDYTRIYLFILLERVKRPIVRLIFSISPNTFIIHNLYSQKRKYVGGRRRHDLQSAVQLAYFCCTSKRKYIAFSISVIHSIFFSPVCPTLRRFKADGWSCLVDRATVRKGQK